MKLVSISDNSFVLCLSWLAFDTNSAPVPSNFLAYSLMAHRFQFAISVPVVSLSSSLSLPSPLRTFVCTFRVHLHNIIGKSHCPIAFEMGYTYYPFVSSCIRCWTYTIFRLAFFNSKLWLLTFFSVYFMNIYCCCFTFLFSSLYFQYPT